MPENLLPFLVLVTVITLTPGPDMALGLRNGIRGGAKGTWWTGLGCCVGITVHASAAVLGLSALLATSAAAYTVVKFAGAAYLLYLGCATLWHARRGSATLASPDRDQEQVPIGRTTAFRQGLLSNILNPKIAVLFLSLLPQFISPGEPRVITSAVLTTVFLVVAVVWWRVYSLLVGTVGHVLTKRRVQSTLERITGTVLVALGVRVALETNT